MRESFTSLFLIYVKPVAAISKILDHGRLWFALVLALGVSLLLHVPAIATFQQAMRTPAPQAAADQKAERQSEHSQDPEREPAAINVFESAAVRWVGASPASILSPILAIALALIPAVIFFRAISGFGSFPVLMRSDYLSLLMCTLIAWAAAYLPFAVAMALMGARGIAFLLPLCVIANLYFAVLGALSIRTVLGIGFGQAFGIISLGCIAAVLGIVVYDVAGPLRYYAMSPFLLYYAYMLFVSDVRALGDGLRFRQHFQRQLEIATNNPRDADAHYQLGLIHQKRHQYSEAIARFQRAVEIDPREADPQFQLGRIALEQNRFDDAIRYLTAAAALDDKLSSSEVWRELGAAYFGSSRFQEAVSALAKYTDRRPYDPEGLYWYGKTLARLDRRTEARQVFEQCIEAVKTMPSHRRAHVRKWGGMAKSEMRSL